MRPASPRRFRHRPLLLSAVVPLLLSVCALPAHADPPPPEVTSPPVLVPADGAYLSGTQTVAADPTVADDSVTALTVDGTVLDARETTGTSELSFEVGSNSTEARYGSYLVVNGEHRLDIGDHVAERVTYDVPNAWLVEGENTVEVRVGTYRASCGDNYDDFDLSDFRLELLGQSANGEDNDWIYSFGDGSCGSNQSRTTEASLSFFVLGDPRRTTGLTAELDTGTLTNGRHQVGAVTASGQSVLHTVTVNNAPDGAPALSPQDGHLTNGTQAVHANLPAGGDGAVQSLTVDGAPVRTRPTLGAGDATFTFSVGSNSIEARYNSFLLVNGQRVDLGGDYAREQVDVVIPNEWLLQGANTIRFVTGTFRTSCGDNRDDYVISGISLQPAIGTATGDGLASSYNVGDGSCGSSSKPREAVLDFTVDGPADGLRADLDTATLDDGEHEVIATSVGGQSATHTLFTDNTAPEVVSSTPAAGERITSSVPFSIQLADDAEVLGEPTYTLDGEPVAVGDLVGPGLGAGAHVLSVEARDSLGNTAVRELRFESAGIPAVPQDLSPASGVADATSPVTLEATVGEPDGGPVEATFSQAEILAPNQAWQGEAATVPTTLRVPGERRIGTAPLEPADERAVESVSSRDVTFQRFDVQLKGRPTAPVLRWEGVIDPTRVATLRAWNVEVESWEPLASARGRAEDAVVLTATVGREYIDGQQVHAMVTGEDPFADDLDSTGRNGFDDPASYDFSLVHLTDTQYLSEGAVEQETAEERAVWFDAYGDVVRWVRDNAERRKIAYFAHTGDIIENNIRPPGDPAMREQAIGEFEVSSRHQKVLDDAGIPNGVIAGNHDNQSGREDGPDALYNQYFGPDRYTAAAEAWEDASYGGPWREGDNQNHYDLFSAGGLDFVVVGLSYGVTREEQEWADAVLKRFPDRNAILLTHDYLQPSNAPDGRDGVFSTPDGSLLYNKLVVDNPNVFLILAGHRHGVATNVKPDVGVVGNGVVELLADYQFYEVTAERLGLTEVGGYAPDQGLRFGASFFRMLQFDVERSELSVDTYSPFLDELGATEYDTRKRYDGREDTMVLPVDLTTRRTRFSSESLGLFEPTKVIGTTTVASGDVASVSWDGLRPDTAYAWLVTARSTGGGVTSSAPSVFATAETRGRPSDALAGLESLGAGRGQGR